MPKGRFASGRGECYKTPMASNTSLEPVTRPCLDQSNSYHPEDCDPEKCAAPFCRRGAKARLESWARAASEGVL